MPSAVDDPHGALRLRAAATALAGADPRLVEADRVATE
jgi:hypothetical protein